MAMDLGILDIIILLIIAASAIFGVFKGFVRQLVSIASLVLGIWCAGKFTGHLSTYIKDWLSLEMSQQTLHIILFIVIFILAVVIAHFLGKGVEGMIKLTMLGWLNRLLGFLFGAIKATMLLSVIAYIVNYANNLLHIIPQSVFSGSQGYAFLLNFQQKIFPFLERIFS